jgi:hypothetical protein
MSAPAGKADIASGRCLGRSAATATTHSRRRKLSVRNRRTNPFGGSGICESSTRSCLPAQLNRRIVFYGEHSFPRRESIDDHSLESAAGAAARTDQARYESQRALSLCRCRARHRYHPGLVLLAAALIKDPSCGRPSAAGNTATRTSISRSSRRTTATLRGPTQLAAALLVEGPAELAALLSWPFRYHRQPGFLTRLTRFEGVLVALPSGRPSKVSGESLMAAAGHVRN